LRVLNKRNLKRILLSILVVATHNYCAAQNPFVNDTIVLSRANAETIFLEKNLDILAERLNIDVAEAQIIQAKLWPNPTLSVGEVNLWHNATSEKLPPLWSNFGTTSEVTVSLEQLLLTAGKRKKMIAIEKVGADMAKEYFKDFLRNLKIEFRKNLTELQFVQAQNEVYQKQLQSIQQLLKGFGNQVAQGNTGKGQYIRLKAVELEFLKQLSDLQKEDNRLQKEFKILIHLPAQNYIKLTNDGFIPDDKSIDNIDVSTLINSALENRPDMKLLQLGTLYSTNKYNYEKALRTPNVTLQASYDRGGNIMNNFVGFGFAVDLPFLNRNQGNIKAAKLAIEQSKYQAEQKTATVQSEVLQAYGDLMAVKKLYNSVEQNYETDLDKLLNSYRKNFIERNTSMLEYLDFVNAYLENKSILLNSKKDLNNHLEELRYITGEE